MSFLSASSRKLRPFLIAPTLVLSGVLSVSSALSASLFGTYQNQYGQAILAAFDPVTGYATGESIASTSPFGNPSEHDFLFQSLTGLAYGKGQLYGTYQNQYGQAILAAFDPVTGYATGESIASTSPFGNPSEHDFLFQSLTGLAYGNGQLYGTYQNQYGQAILAAFDPVTGYA
ncbi:hypothetical protein, partial [Lichenifustis flavocetrariae]